MTAATHPDYLALLAGVLESPGDDAPRLVLADWLEENGEAERGEFIRVQCELAKLASAIDALGPCHCGDPDPTGCGRCTEGTRRGYWKRRGALRRREQELYHPTAERFHQLGWPADIPWPMMQPVFRRGFPAAITCTAEAFLEVAGKLLWRPGEACRGCGGERVTTGWQSFMKQCPACRGTGRRPCPPTAQPIESVMLASLPTSHVPDFNQLRRWIKPLGWGSDLRDSVETEWPQIKFKFPGD